MINNRFSQGHVTYYQQGGQMQKAQQMFISDLAEVTGAKSEQDLKAVVSKIGDKLPQVFQAWAKAEQQQPGGGKKLLTQVFGGGQKSSEQTSGPEQIAYNAPPSAQLGRMGLRFHELQGTCPEGYEIDKFLAGGCVKCRKKKTLELKCGGKKRFTKH